MKHMRSLHLKLAKDSFARSQEPLHPEVKKVAEAYCFLYLLYYVMEAK